MAWLPGAQAAPPGTHATPVGEAIAAARSAAGDDRAGRLRGLAAAGKPAEAARGLAELRRDPALSDAARERLLQDTVLALADTAPDSGLRAEVNALASWTPRTWVWTDEHGHRQEFPLYDVAAAAAFTERRWQEAAAQRATAADLDAGRALDLLARYSTAGAAERRGMEDAVRTVPPAGLAPLRDALLGGLSRGEALGGLALALARRGHDAGLLEAVLLGADGPTALTALRVLDDAAWGGDALGLLETASSRDEIASAALYRIGALLPASPEAGEFLLARLGGPGGATAAHALASAGDPGLIDRLAGILASREATELRRRHALLGLRLADDDRAEGHLAAFAARPDAPPALVQEVPSWLRD